MSTRRTISSLLAVTLASTTLAVVGTVAPASAVTVAPTRVVMQVSQPRAEYKDKISVTGRVEGQQSDGTWGTLPYDSGSVDLQFLPRGSATWRTVQSDDQGYSFYFYPVPVSGTGTYRVSYNGGTYQDYQFTPSSSSKPIKVQRKLTYKDVPGRKAGIQGKVAPGGKLKIVILKKVGKKYRHYKSARTSGSGKFKVILPAPRRGNWYWKIVFTGNKTFEDSVVKGRTYSY